MLFGINYTSIHEDTLSYLIVSFKYINDVCIIWLFHISIFSQIIITNQPEKLGRLLTVFAALTKKQFSHLTKSTIDIISVCNSLPCPVDSTLVVVFIFQVVSVPYLTKKTFEGELLREQFTNGTNLRLLFFSKKMRDFFLFCCVFEVTVSWGISSKQFKKSFQPTLVG